jgi:hypothetical protein
MKRSIPLLIALVGVAVSTYSPAQAQDRQIPRWLEEILTRSTTRSTPSNSDADYGGNYGDFGSSISQDRAALGLREALTVGTTNAVTRTGRVDGFFRNQLIKILMPEKLRPIERTLRAVGAGRQVDDFVLGMNRAAERAAPQARGIFVDAIRGMSFSDVWGILRGNETAATNYFRSRTEARLSQSFRPIVSRSMDDVGATRQYKTLMNRYGNLPFLNQRSLDIDDYVVDAALDGLFKIVAQEEREIRRNPAARVTQVLRDVFGSLRR